MGSETESTTDVTGRKESFFLKLPSSCCTICMTVQPEECCICFKETDYVFPGCRHSCCTECASRWLQRKTQCPVCRQIPYSMPIPLSAKEYVSDHRTSQVVRVAFSEKCTHWGVVLKTCTRSGGGVQICNINPCDHAFKSGLKKNDVILELNGIPMHSHEIAVDVLHAAQRARFPMTFSIRRDLKPEQKLWTYFRRHRRGRTVVQRDNREN